MKRKAMIAIVGTLLVVFGGALAGMCDETEDGRQPQYPPERHPGNGQGRVCSIQPHHHDKISDGGKHALECGSH